MEKTLVEIFHRVFELSSNEPTDDLKYNETENWDSIGHMALVAAIDDSFNIMLDTEDILAMSSFEKAKQIVKTYLVESP